MRKRDRQTRRSALSREALVKEPIGPSSKQLDFREEKWQRAEWVYFFCDIKWANWKDSIGEQYGHTIVNSARPECEKGESRRRGRREVFRCFLLPWKTFYLIMIYIKCQFRYRRLTFIWNSPAGRSTATSTRKRGSPKSIRVSDKCRKIPTRHVKLFYIYKYRVSEMYTPYFLLSLSVFLFYSLESLFFLVSFR